jgi:hypothetical protein
LPVRAKNTNVTITTDLSLYIRVASINRLGESSTESIYKYISGASTTVCKYGSGKIHNFIINDGAAGSSITIYDNTAGTGTIIGTINTATVSAPVSLDFNCPFFTGLTIVVVNAVNFTVIYE